MPHLCPAAPAITSASSIKTLSIRLFTNVAYITTLSLKILLLLASLEPHLLKSKLNSSWMFVWSPLYLQNSCCLSHFNLFSQNTQDRLFTNVIWITTVLYPWNSLAFIYMYMSWQDIVVRDLITLCHRGMDECYFFWYYMRQYLLYSVVLLPSCLLLLPQVSQSWWWNFYLPAWKRNIYVLFFVFILAKLWICCADKEIMFSPWDSVIGFQSEYCSYSLL